MEEPHKRLADYRLRKRRQEKLKAIKIKIKNLFFGGDKMETPPPRVKTEDDLLTLEDLDDTCSVSSLDAVIQHTSDSHIENKWLTYSLRLVYVLFWVTLFAIAVRLRFGIVFLMCSALVGIYLNTRTGPKKINEISAYSVFNENCTSIDGTLKAEQFERELGFRTA